MYINSCVSVTDVFETIFRASSLHHKALILPYKYFGNKLSLSSESDFVGIICTPCAILVLAINVERLHACSYDRTIVHFHYQFCTIPILLTDLEWNSRFCSSNLTLPSNHLTSVVMHGRDDVTKAAADAFRLKVIASKETGSSPPVKLVSFRYIVWWYLF